MKSIKFLSCGVLLLALVSLGACNNETPENNENKDENDDAYYASIASISCSDEAFVSSDEGGTVYFQTEGGSVVVNVDCGTEWTVENHASDLFTTTVSSGTLTITAGQNTVEEDLTSTITVLTAAKRVQFATITVVQSAYGAPQISVGTNSWDIPAKGEGSLTTEIDVECSLDYDVQVNNTWVTYEKTSTGIKLTAENNESTASRSLTVTLSATDGIGFCYASITVNQDAAAYVTLSSDTVKFYEDAANRSVTVESNYDWTYTYDETAGWYTVERDGNTLTVTVTDNEGEQSREGQITVTATDGEYNTAEGIITVSQSAVDQSVMMFIYTIDSGNTTVAVPLGGRVNCTVDWGDGSDETVTSVAPMHTYAEPGEYKVRVSGTVTALYSRNVSSFSYYYQLTEVRQWGKTGLTSMSEAFYTCEELTKLPADVAGSFSEVTTFYDAFRNCYKLVTIEAGLFDYATKATDFSGIFIYCPIETIPEGLFMKCEAAETFSGVFDYCQSLKVIPNDLFKGCSKATNFEYIFFEDHAVEEIGSGLFDGCTSAQTFERAFEYCDNITSIPTGLFDDCVNAENFIQVFRYDPNLESIPDGLFDSCSKATTFEQAFQGCTSLKSIPEGLFKSCTLVNDFTFTFFNCSALTGESAYDVLTIDGQEVKVHLYERLDDAYKSYYPAEIAWPDSWGGVCYTNCTGLDDYYSIPSSWGGGGE